MASALRARPGDPETVAGWLPVFRRAWAAHDVDPNAARLFAAYRVLISRVQ